jgi:putative transcription factor
MDCDMCGKSVDSRISAQIEGVMMSVCQGCTKYGKVVRATRSLVSNKKYGNSSRNIKPSYAESVEEVVSNFATVLKRERTNRKMEQEDFAKLVAEKHSRIQKMEKGEIVPRVETARKIGKILGLKLVGEKEEGDFAIPKSSGEGLTFGDFIKIKKK